MTRERGTKMIIEFPEEKNLQWHVEQILHDLGKECKFYEFMEFEDVGSF